MHALGADTVVDYMARDVFDALDDDSVDAVFDNYGGKGTADKAMSKLRAGGIYLLLPGGGGGTISPHPKPGVRQISFGDVDDHDHATMDRLAAMFDAGKIAINRGPVSGSSVPTRGATAGRPTTTSPAARCSARSPSGRLCSQLPVCC